MAEISHKVNLKMEAMHNDEEMDSPSPTHLPILKQEPSIILKQKGSVTESTAIPSHEIPDLVPATTTTTPANKSPRGNEESEEAREKRRENHRLIERRRRETINNGINELARMVPGNPKNRGTVIVKALEHIRELERIALEAREEAEAMKRENSMLIEELANKNKKINELLLML